MSDEPKAPLTQPALNEEPLAVSNEYDLNQRDHAICTAIYALANEVRALRKVMSLEVANNLDNITDAINGIDVPTYEGAVQVEICRGDR